MVDKCVDVSNKEQVLTCFRHVSQIFEVQEDFGSLYSWPDITTDIVHVI